MFGLEGEKEKVHTWFKVGSALVREHHDHVSVYAGNGRAIGESTQTRLPESSDGVAASITWRATAALQGISWISAEKKVLPQGWLLPRCTKLVITRRNTSIIGRALEFKTFMFHSIVKKAEL